MMPRTKVLIIEDEQPAVDVITALCAQLANDLSVEGIAFNGKQAIQMINEKKPDLVFLDVDMPFINGLQMLKLLPELNFEIIFTTGSDAYAMNALKLQAVDYLLKPINPEDFIVAIEKARKRISLKSKNFDPRKIELHTNRGVLFVEEKNIIYVKGLGSYSNIITTDASGKILVSKSIGCIQRLLSDNFFRCHNSNLVNITYVKQLVNKDGHFVVLKNGTSLEVSRRNKNGLLKKLACKM